MRMQPIKDGDIVRVNDGLPYLAVVDGRDMGKLVVKPLMEGRRRQAPRHVPARWVDSHWRLVRGGA